MHSGGCNGIKEAADILLVDARGMVAVSRTTVSTSITPAVFLCWAGNETSACARSVVFG